VVPVVMMALVMFADSVTGGLVAVMMFVFTGTRRARGRNG